MNKQDINENEILERLSSLRNKPVSKDWLIDNYSLKLPLELKILFTQHIGTLEKQGWEILKALIDLHGVQPEFIKAAGISHQDEARQYLLGLLDKDNEYKVEVIEALACWGAILPIELIRKILKEPSQKIKLAGLELLHFKAHKLTDQELISLTKELILDFREEVVLKTISILQRRNGIEIINILHSIVMKGSDLSAEKAIMALGSIENKASQDILKQLSSKLPQGRRLELTRKVAANQFR